MSLQTVSRIYTLRCWRIVYGAKHSDVYEFGFLTVLHSPDASDVAEVFKSSATGHYCMR